MDALARGLLLWFLMAVGVTQPGGAGTTIFVYDDASSALGTGYRFSEISAAFPLDFIDLGTLTKPSYRSKVDLQVGDVGAGTATTSLVDTDFSSVIWDNTKTLKNRNTQTTSWNYNLGTKIGTGSISTGVKATRLAFGAATSLQGNHSIYGCVFLQTVGAMTLTAATSGTGEIVNSLFQSTATGTAPINLGSSTNKLGTIYNCDISHTTTAQVMTNFFATNVERLTIGASTPTALISSNAADVTLKDATLFGSPTQSDFRWGGASATSWRIYRPIWTGNGPKFSIAVSGFPPLDDAFFFHTIEFWRYDAKAVSGIDGAPIPGILVSLTDRLGNNVANAVSGSDGQLTFGSGITTNMVPVMDHYAVGTVYTQRHRSPFLVEVNVGAGANPNYHSQRYYMKWPGYESVTTTSGQFEDVTDIIPLLFAGGGPTTWTEITV